MREKAGIWNLTTFLIDLQIWNLWPFHYTEKRKIPTAVQQCPVPVKYVATGKRLWVPLKYLISCKAGIGVSGDRVGLSLILYSLTSNSIYMIVVLFSRVLGTDCGDHVSDWISEALGRPGCRLIQQNNNHIRTSKLKDKENGICCSWVFFFQTWLNELIECYCKAEKTESTVLRDWYILVCLFFIMIFLQI